MRYLIRLETCVGCSPVHTEYFDIVYMSPGLNLIFDETTGPDRDGNVGGMMSRTLVFESDDDEIIRYIVISVYDGNGNYLHDLSYSTVEQENLKDLRSK